MHNDLGAEKTVYCALRVMLMILARLYRIDEKSSDAFLGLCNLCNFNRFFKKNFLKNFS
jgi:hypothetical protein